MKYKLRFRLRFKYWKDDKGIFHRKVRLWWWPLYWLGNQDWFAKQRWGYEYGAWHWWVRRHITFD